MSNVVLLRLGLLYCTLFNEVRLKYIRFTLQLSNPQCNNMIQVPKKGGFWSSEIDVDLPQARKIIRKDDDQIEVDMNEMVEKLKWKDFSTITISDNTPESLLRHSPTWENEDREATTLFGKLNTNQRAVCEEIH